MNENSYQIELMCAQSHALNPVDLAIDLVRSPARMADQGGPRCCKRDTFLALKSAPFSMSIPVSDPLFCDFSHLNREYQLVDSTFNS